MAGNKIQADYDQLAQLANLFVQEAQNIESWTGKAAQAVDALQSGGWSGEAANKFFNEWQSILPNLNKLRDALETSSSQVQVISQIFTDGENRASARVKTINV